MRPPAIFADTLLGGVQFSGGFHMGAVSEPKERLDAAVRRWPNLVAEPARPSPLRAHVFARVPTHVVDIVGEQRRAPRAFLRLPMRLTRVDGREEPVPVTLLTKNISAGGVYFLAPRNIAPGTPIEFEVGLVDRPLGQGSVRMATSAHVVRIDPSETPGWHGIAASFDDFDFQRDEAVPARFRSP